MTSPSNNPTAKNPETALSESQYLHQESVRASIAMNRSWKKAQRNLLYGLNPKRSIKEHPWITLGSALALGAGVAATVAYQKKHPHETNGTPAPVPDKAGERRGKRRMRWVVQGLNLLRPLVMSLVTTAITATVSPPQEDPGNGSATPRERV
jgi:hypothetical protein